jgi:hypothetical protein
MRLAALRLRLSRNDKVYEEVRSSKPKLYAGIPEVNLWESKPCSSRLSVFAREEWTRSGTEQQVRPCASPLCGYGLVGMTNLLKVWRG